MKSFNNIPKTFGKVLKDIRLEKNLSQQDLANSSGVDRGYISQVELGNSAPSIVTLFKIAEGLEIKPQDLIAGVDKITKK